MLKKTRTKTDILQRFGRYITIHDVDPLSRNYFRFLEFPDRLYRGKNMIRLNANDQTLAVGSEIYIEFIDANGNSIYHEIIDYIDKDKSRIIVVYVYDDTPIGEFTALFAARTLPVSNNEELSYPNLLWSSVGIVVPSQPTKSDVIFTKQPKIKFNEVKTSYLEVTSSVGRVITRNATDPNAKIFDVSYPIQFNKTREYTTKFDSDKFIVKQPSNIETDLTKGVSPERVDLPLDGNLSLVEIKQLRFEADMVGSIITFNNIDITRFIPNDVTRSLFDVGTIPAYSASIVKVLTNERAYVYPPFKHSVTYVNNSGEKKSITFRKFIGADTTASYYNADTLATQGTPTSQSLLVANISNLDPAVGNVDKVRVSYKGYGSLGEFEEFGTYPIEQKNVLIKGDSYKTTNRFGVIKEEVGVFHQSNVIQYWTSQSFGNVGNIAFSFDRVSLMNSLKISITPPATNKDYYAVYPKQQYAISSSRDTEYELTFDAYSEITGSSSTLHATPQMDIYISGSSITTETKTFTKRNYLEPINDKNNLGTYIGTILGGDNTYTLDKQISFECADNKFITPKFIIRQGNWNLANIKITPRKNIGFTPNDYELVAPLERVKKDTEYIFKIDYLSQEGRTANIQTEMYGVRFEGGNNVLYPGDVISGSSWNPSQLGPGYWTASATGIFYEQGHVDVGGSERTIPEIGPIHSKLYVTGSSDAGYEWDTATFYSPHVSGSYITILGNTGASTFGRGIKFMDSSLNWHAVIGSVPRTEEFKIRVGNNIGLNLSENQAQGITTLRISEVTGDTAIGGKVNLGYKLSVSGNVSMSANLELRNNLTASNATFSGNVTASSYTGNVNLLNSHKISLTDNTSSYTNNNLFTWNGITIAAYSAQTTKFGDVIFMFSPGIARLSRANLSATIPAIAIGIASGAAGDLGNFLLQGVINKPNWNWIHGKPLYIQTGSGQGGELTQAIPNRSGDKIQMVGYALSSTSIYWNPTYVTSSVP